MSLVFNLPLSYASRIAAVPGVKRVATTSWFGGSLPAKKEGKAEEGSETTTDWSNFFPNMAVDEDPYFAMYPEFEIPPDQYKAFKEDLQGAVIGRKLATKFNWKVGDHFFLESFIPPYRKKSGPFEFTVRAIFDTDPVKHPNTDTNLMLFHYKYLYEGTGQHIAAGTYNIEINDPAHVSFTILLVTANTMSMAVRERRTEIAVLKTLGFSSLQVMGLIVAEAIALGAIGGGLGLSGSQGLMYVLTHAPGIKDMLAGIGLSELHLKLPIAALGFSVALALGFAAGFVPAMNAYRARITDMLRTV